MEEKTDLKQFYKKRKAYSVQILPLIYLGYICSKQQHLGSQSFFDYTTVYAAQYAVPGNSLPEGISKYQKYPVVPCGSGNRGYIGAVLKKRFAGFVSAHNPLRTGTIGKCETNCIASG